MTHTNNWNLFSHFLCAIALFYLPQAALPYPLSYTWSLVICMWHTCSYGMHGMAWQMFIQIHYPLLSAWDVIFSTLAPTSLLHHQCTIYCTTHTMLTICNIIHHVEDCTNPFSSISMYWHMKILGGICTAVDGTGCCWQKTPGPFTVYSMVSYHMIHIVLGHVVSAIHCACMEYQLYNLCIWITALTALQLTLQ